MGLYLGCSGSAGSMELVGVQQAVDVLLLLVVVIVKANATARTFDPQNDSWINQTVP